MVILTHPYQTESIHDLPETPEYAELIPRGYGGAIQTNRIDKITGLAGGNAITKVRIRRISS